MINCFHSRLPSICIFILLIPILLNSVLAAERDQLFRHIKNLDEAYKDVSYEFFNTPALHPLETITQIEVLLQEVERLFIQGKRLSAVQRLYANRQTLEENIDHPAILKITELLLQQNEWQLSNHIYELVKQENDKSLLSALQFIFAKYHTRRKEWPEVRDLLRDSIAELSEQQEETAYLLNGTALQHLKQHREATENYAKISVQSPLYLFAQLNTAIANIRQGWLAEAQSKIYNIIPVAKRDDHEEMTERLYLVLGYAFMQKEYYRDARKSFRQISLQSRYSNRALLGIGLSATSHGDFIGGLNALAILQQKNSQDLAIDESYLVIPYVYEKLQQELVISASYSEAISYYQQRIKNLEKLLTQDINFENTRYDRLNNTLQLENVILDLGTDLPDYFFSNFKNLQQFRAEPNQSIISNRIDSLITEYENTLKQLTTYLVHQRIEQLNSYLNQSRYGLAHLYDRSRDVKKP